MASDMMSVASSVSTRGAQSLDWLCNEIQREGEKEEKENMSVIEDGQWT